MRLILKKEKNIKGDKVVENKPWLDKNIQSCYGCGKYVPSGIAHCDNCYDKMGGNKYAGEN